MMLRIPKGLKTVAVRRTFFPLLCATTLLATIAHAADLRIQGSESDNSVEFKLLKEIVNRSDQYDQLVYPYEGQRIPQSKLQEDVQSGSLDVIFVGASASIEERMQAVYVPIYRGTLGMRLGIVEKDKKDILANVNSMDDLLKFKACQGKTWADTEILEANGIDIAKSLKYANIFLMVEADRCDYFPRAIFEPWSEVASREELNLTVDSNILLRYTMPLFFFVGKDKQPLAKHMTDILYDMQADGTYDDIFFADDRVKEALSLSNLKDRRVFDLENPYATDEVKAIPERFWLDPLGETQ